LRIRCLHRQKQRQGSRQPQLVIQISHVFLQNYLLYVCYVRVGA
jgi:hypothetical protein